MSGAAPAGPIANVVDADVSLVKPLPCTEQFGKRGHAVRSTKFNASLTLPAHLLVVFISNVGDGALTVPIPKVPVPTYP
jgi:hypothetical protein